MNRKWLLALCLMITAIVMSGCSSNNSGENYATVTQNIGPSYTQAPFTDSSDDSSDGASSGIFASNPYDVDMTGDDGSDALDEEDYDPLGGFDDADTGGFDENGYMDYVAQTVFPYAGATPIPLDPVDMPTPTPRAPLTFAYVAYQAPLLGLTFEGPANWVPDESMADTYTLTEPVEQMKDGQLGIIQISKAPVTKQYSESELKTEVIQRIETIGSTNYSGFSRSNTASRYMLGSKGVYARYSGTLASGVQNGGRLIVVCIDRTLYCLHVQWPLTFAEDYRDIYDKIRDSLKTIQ